MSGYEQLEPQKPPEASLETLEGEHVDIEEDVYGAAVFSITYDFFEMFTGKDHDGLTIWLNIYRVTFVCLLLFCNYLFQIGLLFWVYRYVARPSVHQAQELYRDYHWLTFKNGKFDQQLWDKWPDVPGLCGLAFSNFWFMYMILSLWWVIMLAEVRKTERLFRKFRQLPTTSDPNDMIRRSVGPEHPNLITMLTPVTRCFLYCALLLPKILIAMVLMVVGTVWLVASDSFADLILNSVALEFIICIDEILFEGLLPESIKKDINGTKLVTAAPKKSGNLALDAKEHEDKVKAGYYRSTGYLILITVGVYLYLSYGQDLPYVGVFPGYMHDADCPIWWKQQTKEICQPGVECFPINQN